MLRCSSQLWRGEACAVPRFLGLSARMQEMLAKAPFRSERRPDEAASDGTTRSRGCQGVDEIGQLLTGRSKPVDGLRHGARRSVKDKQRWVSCGSGPSPGGRGVSRGLVVPREQRLVALVALVLRSLVAGLRFYKRESWRSTTPTCSRKLQSGSGRGNTDANKRPCWTWPTTPSRCAIWRNDIVYWNKGAERLYGWTAAEALGQQRHRAPLPGDPPRLDEARQILFQTRRMGRRLEPGHERWSGNRRRNTLDPGARRPGPSQVHSGRQYGRDRTGAAASPITANAAPGKHRRPGRQCRPRLQQPAQSHPDGREAAARGAVPRKSSNISCPSCRPAPNAVPRSSGSCCPSPAAEMASVPRCRSGTSSRRSSRFSTTRFRKPSSSRSCLADEPRPCFRRRHPAFAGVDEPVRQCPDAMPDGWQLDHRGGKRRARSRRGQAARRRPAWALSTA